MTRIFRTLIDKQWSEGKFVCVGLDSQLDKIPEHILSNRSLSRKGYSDGDCISEFNRAIVEATHDIVCAYKLNTAFYEALGAPGIRALKLTISDIHFIDRDIPVILDAKRGDTVNTNNGYLKFAFEYLGADAITVHPYMGQKSLQPFLDCIDKGIFVLCRTSNDGAGEFQDLLVRKYPEGEFLKPMYQQVAHRVSHCWNGNQNCGLVVGATNTDELHRVRRASGNLPILIPGIGKQGGDLEKTILAGKNAHNSGIIVSASRSVIFASDGTDFAQFARKETHKLSASIANLL